MLEMFADVGGNLLGGTTGDIAHLASLRASVSISRSSTSLRPARLGMSRTCSKSATARDPTEVHAFSLWCILFLIASLVYRLRQDRISVVITSFPIRCSRRRQNSLERKAAREQGRDLESGPSAADGRGELALFNRGPRKQKSRQIHRPQLTGTQAVRDMWRHKDLGTSITHTNSYMPCWCACA